MIFANPPFPPPTFPWLTSLMCYKITFIVRERNLSERVTVTLLGGRDPFEVNCSYLKYLGNVKSKTTSVVLSIAGVWCVMLAWIYAVLLFVGE